MLIPVADLKTLARARLKDARVLLRAGRYDTAAYVCGYAVELALKARICKTLGWTQFPPAKGDDYRSFTVHKLEVLLNLSGCEARVRTRYVAEWSAVSTWDSTDRYKAIGSTTEAGARLMINSTASLLTLLLRGL